MVPVRTVEVTISGSGGTKPRSYVEINGTTYSAADVLTVEYGTTIKLSVVTGSGYPEASITVYGQKVVSNTNTNSSSTYELTLDRDISIGLSQKSGSDETTATMYLYGVITVTEV